MTTIWFRVDAEFRAHPKVAIVRRALKCSKMEALGIVTSLWSLAAEHGVAGDLSDLPVEFIEEWFTPVKGDVIAALQEAGYLDGLKVHDWSDHNGQLDAWQRRKQVDAERKRLLREQQKAAEEANRPRIVHGLSVDASADSPADTSADKVRTVRGRNAAASADGPADESADLYIHRQKQEQKNPPTPHAENPAAVELLAAYCAAFRIGTMTAAQRSRWLAVTDDLLATGADTDDVLTRAHRLRDSWPAWRGDLPALATRWADLADPVPEPAPPPTLVSIGDDLPPPTSLPPELRFAAQNRLIAERRRRG